MVIMLFKKKPFSIGFFLYDLQCTSTINLLLTVGGMSFFAMQRYAPISERCILPRVSSSPLTESTTTEKTNHPVGDIRSKCKDIVLYHIEGVQSDILYRYMLKFISSSNYVSIPFDVPDLQFLIFAFSILYQ